MQTRSFIASTKSTVSLTCIAMCELQRCDAVPCVAAAGLADCAPNSFGLHGVDGSSCSKQIAAVTAVWSQHGKFSSLPASVLLDTCVCDIPSCALSNLQRQILDLLVPCLHGQPGTGLHHRHAFTLASHGSGASSHIPLTVNHKPTHLGYRTTTTFVHVPCTYARLSQARSGRNWPVSTGHRPMRCRDSLYAEFLGRQTERVFSAQRGALDSMFRMRREENHDAMGKPEMRERAGSCHWRIRLRHAFLREKVAIGCCLL